VTGGSDSSSPTRTTDELATVLAEHRPNQRVRVALRRADGSRTTVDVRLGGSPGWRLAVALPRPIPCGMSVRPTFVAGREPEDIAPSLPEDLRLFARLEGLVGQEHALLSIPAHERTSDQHDRLRAITAELDRLWERLQERAERLARREKPDESRP
jgi:hypothetical protein